MLVLTSVARVAPGTLNVAVGGRRRRNVSHLLLSREQVLALRTLRDDLR